MATGKSNLLFASWVVIYFNLREIPIENEFSELFHCKLRTFAPALSSIGVLWVISIEEYKTWSRSPSIENTSTFLTSIKLNQPSFGTTSSMLVVLYTFPLRFLRVSRMDCHGHSLLLGSTICHGSAQKLIVVNAQDCEAYSNSMQRYYSPALKMLKGRWRRRSIREKRI